MSLILVGNSFNYSPTLCGGGLLDVNFNPASGKGWNRYSYIESGIERVIWFADGNNLWASGPLPREYVVAAGSNGMAGRERAVHPHIARMEYPLLSLQGSGALINRDITKEDYFLEIRITGIAPDEWPDGGSGSHSRFRNTCAIGLCLFAPSPAAGSSVFHPCYQLYWMRNSSKHPTAPGEQAVYGEIRLASDIFIPDNKGTILTGTPGKLTVLGGSGSLGIDEIAETGSFTLRVRFYRPQSYVGLGMQILFNDSVIGSENANINGEMGFTSRQLESWNLINFQEAPEKALERHFGIFAWNNADDQSADIRDFPAASTIQIVRVKHQVALDTFIIRDINASETRPIFPMPELVTEPTLETVTLEGEGASDSDPVLPIQPERLWVPDERMDVQDFDYDTGHVAALGLQSKSRPTVQFDFVLETTSDLSTFKSFISQITALDADGRFRHDDRYWRIREKATVTTLGGGVFKATMKAEEIFSE